MKNVLYEKKIKRIVDLILAFWGIVLLAILIIPISIMIKIEDGGPIFYCSIRLGKNKVQFKMFKFRTMKVKSPDIRLQDGSTYNSPLDSRMTRIGKFLREKSLDELPQVINVLFGHMSFIGPRPDVLSNEGYPLEFSSIWLARPGITGYTQAFFRNDINRFQKMQYDKIYVEHITFILDLKIILKTILVVITQKSLYKTN